MTDTGSKSEKGEKREVRTKDARGYMESGRKAGAGGAAAACARLPPS